jgi:hypothetical protein
LEFIGQRGGVVRIARIQSEHETDEEQEKDDKETGVAFKKLNDFHERLTCR